MRIVLVLLFAMVIVGCKSKPIRRAPAYAQPPAMPQMTVQVRGDVRHGMILWDENLTLTSALIEADYIGRLDPLSVTVRRGRKVERFSAYRLLSGQGDMFLLPGDIIDINR